MDNENVTPLVQNSNELADMILTWYEEQVQKKYYMHDIYNQLVRSATSVGANIAEAKFAQSNADYKSKMHIALKEANETRYWIQRLTLHGSISSDLNVQLLKRVESILNILVSITNPK